MTTLDWRSPKDYANLQEADMVDLAWECLRRNPDYQRDYRRVVAMGSPDRIDAQFRRVWGLSFRS
jgi:transcriptional regulator